MSRRLLPARHFLLGSMLLLSIASSPGVVSAAVTAGNSTCELTDSNNDTVHEIASQADLLDFKADFADCASSHLLQTASFVVDNGTATNFGDPTTPFAGTYDGGNHTITFHNLAGTSGLFGHTDGAIIRNLHLAASGTTALTAARGWFAYHADDTSFVNISSSGNMTAIATAGITYEALDSSFVNVSSSGNMTVTSSAGIAFQVGGNTTVVSSHTTGDIDGVRSGGFFHATDDNTTITNSYTTGDANGFQSGGLIYLTEDNTTITNSYTTGDLNNQYAAGLVSYSIHNTTITNSYTTGDINGLGAAGLVAYTKDYTSISNSYTTGNVEGDVAAGLVAFGNDNTSISNSYTTGDINGLFAGGIVAEANDNTTISNTYTTGDIGGMGAGLVNSATGSATIANSYTTGNFTGPGAVGLVLDDNTSAGLDLSTAFHDPDGQWSTTDANRYLTGVPSSIPGQGAVWGACTDDTPFFLVVFADANRCTPPAAVTPVTPIWRVTLDPNGGTCVDSTERTEPWTAVFVGYRYLPNATDCTRPNFTFTGWATTTDPSTPVTLPILVDPSDNQRRAFLAANADLIAMWTPNPTPITDVTVFANFMCGPCTTLWLIHPPVEPDTTIDIFVNGQPTTFSTSIETLGLSFCEIEPLAPGDHTITLTPRHDNITGTPTRISITLKQ